MTKDLFPKTKKYPVPKEVMDAFYEGHERAMEKLDQERRERASAAAKARNETVFL